MADLETQIPSTSTPAKTNHLYATKSPYTASTDNIKILISAVLALLDDLSNNLDVNGNEIISVSGGDIVLHSDNDLNIILGDAAGVDDFNIKDSANVIVLGVDSDGNLTLSGTVDGRDVAADGTTLDTAILDADYSSNGLQTRTGSGAYTSRTVTGTSDQISVTDGDGVSGNPTLALANNLSAPGTEGINLAGGTTAQRPGTPAEGDFRKNTTTNKAEYYDGSAWISLGGGSSWFNHVYLNSISASQTLYCLPEGDENPQATETNAQVVAQETGTLKRLIVYCSAAGTYTTDVTVRVNAADSALTLQCAASTTGFNEFDADVAVTEGDKISIEIVSGAGSGFTRLRHIGVKYE